MGRTIPEFLDHATREHGDRVWLRTDEVELSYATLGELLGAARARLHDAGVRQGTHVVLTARNEPRYLVALLAATTMGAVAVPVNPRSTRPELAGLLTQLAGGDRTRVIVTDDELSSLVRAACDDAGLGVPTMSASAFMQPADHPVTAPDPAGVREDEVAVMIPTSGTTGRSKLVMQTHRAYVMAGEGFAHWLELAERDRLMTSMPLFHTNALAYSVMGSVACGGSLVLLPRFSASGFLSSARRHGATQCNVVGAMLEALMGQPAGTDDKDHPLRKCYVAPSPPQQRHREIEERFGIRLVCGYGMSESMYGLIWLPGTRPFGTLGWPRQHPELGVINHARVVDDDSREVPNGVSGELLLRNPTVTPGYYGMPEETRAVLRDGWLHTGDLVTRNDDGTYTFVARKKEVIRHKGENLAPAEIEQTLTNHADVVECTVAGVPAGMAEEDIKAYVVLAPGAASSARSLGEWLSDRLATFKIPRYWQFVDQLPRTPTGRVARHRLADAGSDDVVDLAPMSTREAS